MKNVWTTIGNALNNPIVREIIALIISMAGKKNVEDEEKEEER